MAHIRITKHERPGAVFKIEIDGVDISDVVYLDDFSLSIRVDDDFNAFPVLNVQIDASDVAIDLPESLLTAISKAGA